MFGLTDEVPGVAAQEARVGGFVCGRGQSANEKGILRFSMTFIFNSVFYLIFFLVREYRDRV